LTETLFSVVSAVTDELVQVREEMLVMNDNEMRGMNFACFHAGPKEGWTHYRVEPPEVPMPTRGKLFLRNHLGSAGLEMSLNVVPTGKGMPFLH
jgi:hypothetical protein